MNILRFTSSSRSERVGGEVAGRRTARPLAASSGIGPSRARPTGGMVYGPHASRNSPGWPDAARPPAPETTMRADFVALVRGWMRVLTPTAWVGVHEAPHPIVVGARRWAPVLAPAVVGSALLTLALALVAHGRSPYAPLPGAATIPALLAVYLLCGLLLGLALHFAPNGVVWSLALFGGPALLLTIMLTIVFGAPGGLLALALLAALLLVYSIGRGGITRVGEVEVTLLLGEWYRTLPPGYNILLPGERVITTLRTTPRAFTTPMQRVALASNRGAQARATVSYLVNPDEAWRTAPVRATWEGELRQRISESVRGSLAEWRFSPDGGLAARGSIARRALEETRDWARSVGVRILSVRAHDIAIGAPEELQPPAAASAARATPRIVATAPAGPSPAPSPAPSTVPFAAVPSGFPPTPMQRRTPAQAVERPSPAALEDLYEAVRNRQITDTQVIREIAAHFARLARNPLPTDGALPFDPIAAARLLDDYAEALDAAQSTPPQAARRR